MRLAPEGLREMLLATALLGGGAWLAIGLGYWPAAVPLAIVWVWVISFFRDPPRVPHCGPGELCSPADGTVTEISRLDHDERIGGPAWHIGIFLSIFDVHINRSPCSGTVRSISHAPGKHLDARHRDSGPDNESNTVVIDPVPPIRGPVVVRQVAGRIARRIICHAVPGQELPAGCRFGLIKFGSRTELILPDDGAVEVIVALGSKVRAGTTILARQLPIKNPSQDPCGAGFQLVESKVLG